MRSSQVAGGCTESYSNAVAAAKLSKHGEVRRSTESKVGWESEWWALYAEHTLLTAMGGIDEMRCEEMFRRGRNWNRSHAFPWPHSSASTFLNIRVRPYDNNLMISMALEHMSLLVAGPRPSLPESCQQGWIISRVVWKGPCQKDRTSDGERAAAGPALMLK